MRRVKEHERIILTLALLVYLSVPVDGILLGLQKVCRHCHAIRPDVGLLHACRVGTLADRPMSF
jgi:hypothetical protein